MVVELVYDPVIAQENSGRPFGVGTIRPIQLSSRNVGETLIRGRARLITNQRTASTS